MRVVAKFGGTSVRSAHAIEQVSKIIEANPSIHVIVVSAVGGVTNLLVNLCNQAFSKRHEIIYKIKSIHLSLAHDLGIDIDEKINKKIDVLERLSSAREIVPAVADQILSTGEDLSSLIIYSFLLHKGINIELVEIREYLVTDDNFGKATPKLDIIKIRMANLPQARFITQGFIGGTPEGNTTTLGRGGSDYSAALIAEAISADELHVYTDVKGVYTIDPNLSKNARLVKALGFQEMAEIANFGAKVLHPATVEPCIRAGVPVRILSTFAPHEDGTFITSQKNSFSELDKTFVTVRKNQSLVTIKSNNLIAGAFLANLFSILAKYRISTDLVNITEDKVALVIDAMGINSQAVNPFFHNDLLLMEVKQFAEILVEEGLALVSIIGSKKQLYNLPKHAITNHYGMTKFISYAANNSSLCILVNSDAAPALAVLIHEEIYHSI